VRPAPTLWRARPARPVLRSSVQVPCNHSCEAIAPVRLISVHRRRNLNGDSLMHTVDRGREWPYFDVSHCSTVQSGGSAVRLGRRGERPNATASGHGRVSRAAKARPQSTRERPLSRWGMGESQGPRFRLNNRTYIETCDLRMPKPH
jgi:hypothetical protein